MKVQRENFLGILTELYRTFESHSSELSIISQELFRNFSKSLSNCIEPSSERVYNNLQLISADDIEPVFAYSSFVLYFPNANTVNLPFDFTIKRQAIINRRKRFSIEWQPATKENWQLWIRKTVRNIPGMFLHQPQMFLDHRRTI